MFLLGVVVGVVLSLAALALWIVVEDLVSRRRGSGG